MSLTITLYVVRFVNDSQESLWLYDKSRYKNLPHRLMTDKEAARRVARIKRYRSIAAARKHVNRCECVREIRRVPGWSMEILMLTEVPFESMTSVVVWPTALDKLADAI